MYYLDASQVTVSNFTMQWNILMFKSSKFYEFCTFTKYLAYNETQTSKEQILFKVHDGEVFTDNVTMFWELLGNIVIRILKPG